MNTNAMKGCTLKNQTVVLYVNTDELVILPDGTVVSGVRAETPDVCPSEALCNAVPRRGEDIGNAHFVSLVVVARGLAQ